MKHTLTLLTALLLAPLAAPLAALHAADHALFMNEDAWHYFVAAPEVKRGKGDELVEVMRPEFTLTKKGLENYIDEIARGHVTHFLMNLNTQRANFPSKTLEPVWKSLEEPERYQLDYIRAMKALYESGVDPYKVWIDRCRVKGIQPWISIRMNDLHRTDDPKSPEISTFWHEHPEYRLGSKSFDGGLDYTFEPVRRRMLDFITEVLDRYDPDGLELDLIRFPRYLPVGREKEGATVFTAYLREIRKIVNAAAAKRGHKITLSVRLLPKPSESRNLGMEADVWAKEGIVDLIVPCNHWVSIDFDIPLAEWRTWTGDKVAIVPGADSGITENGKRRLATFEEYRRWARIMHERGAKSLYLYNLFMHPQDGPVWNGVLSRGLPPLAALHAAEPVTIDLAKRTWQGIPGLERTAKGRVFVSWFTGGTKEPEPENTVLLSHSDDGGKTFSAPQAMGLPLNDGTRCFDPTLWIDPKSRLWYIFNRGNKDAAKHDVWARICDDPDASPPVWGAEFRVGYDSPYAFRMNKPTVLSTGEWIMPVTHATETIQSWFAHPKQLQGVGISTDEGKTWSLHGALKAPAWALEGMVTELKDGRLWLLTRTGGGFLWESHSTDKGRTWSEAKASTIANPGSRFFIRRLASGNLLLVNHYKFTGRSHLTAQLSTDDGATWNDGLLLDERSGVSYPDGMQDKDGLIWITYDRDRGGAGDILLAKFKEEDVVAGKNVSGAVTLKQVVNKLDKPSILPANWDAALAGDVVLKRLVKVTAPQVKGAHDAEFVCVGDRAYVVSEVNDLKGGEDGSWPFIYSTLSIVNLETLKTERVIDFAKGEQAFANETLPSGACWVPRIIQKDANTLRCYFVSQDPGKRQSQMWYRDFDLSRGEFAPTIHKAKLKTAAGTFDFQPLHFHADAVTHGFKKKASDSFFFVFDSFKEFDGKLYVALNNFTGQQNALALVHDDLETFEVIGHYNEPQSAALSESAVNRLPDGTWMAICRNDKGNYHFTTSKDGKTWTIGEPKPFVPNGLNSKPTFEKFGGIYYLGWQEATSIQGAYRSVFNVDISRDGRTWERKYRFETPQSFQYPAFHEHEGAIWLCVTQGDTDPSRKERIMFGKLETVGDFEPQKGHKRIDWPAPPPPEPAFMKRGVKLFTDREYVIDEMPDAVRDLPFHRTSIEKTDVTVTKAGKLFALTPTIRPKAASQEEALQKAGFTKVDVSEVQLFPGEINRVSLYRKDVKPSERLTFEKMVLLIMGAGVEIRTPPPK